MNEPLARFLITLAGDVHRLGQFSRAGQSRDVLLQASALPIQDQAALLSGDADRIYDALEGVPDDGGAALHAAKKPGVKKAPVKKRGPKKPPVKKRRPKKPPVKKPGPKKPPVKNGEKER